jgi:hypothetical protein
MQAPVISDISGSIGIPPCQEFLPVMENTLETKADAILKAFRQRCGEAGLKPDIKKRLGVIDEVIIEEGQQADWIILAQRGEHFHLGGGAILGTTAESVVRKAGNRSRNTRAPTGISKAWHCYDGSPPRKCHEAGRRTLREAAWPLTVVMVSNDTAISDRCAKQAETLWKLDHRLGLDPVTGKEEREFLRFLQWAPPSSW